MSNSGNRTNDQRVPLVATCHPALNSLGRASRRLHPMRTNSEEHMKLPEPPLIVFRRCKYLKDILDRLSSEGNGGTDKKGCSRCGKSRC